MNSKCDRIRNLITGKCIGNLGREGAGLTQEPRQKWDHHSEFVITCIGSAVGLGNVYRFPHLCYANGGGAFLIPYFICLFLIGLPIFFLEIVFGQFSSLGTIAAWEINPLMKGLGYSLVLVVAYGVIYYNALVAQCLYFMIASLSSNLPWMSCGNEWNTCNCRTIDMETNLSDPMLWHNSTGLNCTGLIFDASSIKSSSEEYYYNEVLQLTSGLDVAGSMNGPLTLCNLLLWTLSYLVVFMGIKSIGKVVYVSTLLPFVLLTVLVMKCKSLSGADTGLEFYMSFDIQKITTSKVWKDAAAQVLFTLSACQGSVMTLSSYNNFHANSIRDCFIVGFIDTATSIYAGVAVFSVLGYMAHTTNEEVETVITSGNGLAFVTYPTALGTLPLAQMWSFLFFLMMVLLGMGSQFPGVETVITSIQDEFPSLREKKLNVVFRALICILGFLLGLPQTTQGGNWLVNLCDTFYEYLLLFCALFECVAIVLIYGPENFSEDMHLMLGYNKINRVLYDYYFKWTLIVSAPLLILLILLYNATTYEPITTDPGYPAWAETLGWLSVAFIMMLGPLWYLLAIFINGGGKLLRELNRPTQTWGPALEEHRTIPRYRAYLETRDPNHTGTHTDFEFELRGETNSFDQPSGNNQLGLVKGIADSTSHAGSAIFDAEGPTGSFV